MTELVFQKESTNTSNELKQCMICYYWCFKHIGYKLEPEVCNKCYDISMMVYDLAHLMILNIRGVDYRSFAFNIVKL